MLEGEAARALGPGHAVTTSGRVFDRFAPDLQIKLRGDLAEHFIPEAFTLVNEAVEIEATASRYDRAVREINAAFYTPALADKAGTRVEV